MRKSLKRILPLLGLVLVYVLMVGIVMAATTAVVTINATGSEVSINNTPTTFDFGTLSADEQNNTTYLYFTAGNEGSENVDITIRGTNMSRCSDKVDQWSLDNAGATGAGNYSLKAGITGGTAEPDFDITVKLVAAFNTLKSTLAPQTTQGWHLNITAPSSSVGNEDMSAEVTLTGSLS